MGSKGDAKGNLQGPKPQLDSGCPTFPHRAASWEEHAPGVRGTQAPASLDDHRQVTASDLNLRSLALPCDFSNILCPCRPTGAPETAGLCHIAVSTWMGPHHLQQQPGAGDRGRDSDQTHWSLENSLVSRGGRCWKPGLSAPTLPPQSCLSRDSLPGTDPPSWSKNQQGTPFTSPSLNTALLTTGEPWGHCEPLPRFPRAPTSGHSTVIEPGNQCKGA